MKALILGIVLISSTVASATSIKIYEARKDGDHVKVEFAINRELGRAWVEVTEEDYSDEGAPYAQKVKVAGLSFDAESSTILLEREASSSSALSSSPGDAPSSVILGSTTPAVSSLISASR